MGKRRLQN